MWHGDVVPSLFGSLLGLFMALLLIRLIALVGGRLLGVQQSWWRILTVGILGTLVGIGFATAVGAQRLMSAATPLVYFASILMATMLFSVAFESLAPPVDTARSGPASLRAMSLPHPLRGTRRRLSRWARYLQISSIVARHGLLPYLVGRRRLPGGHSDASSTTRLLWKHVRVALEEAGGAFIKLGQVLSSRPDLLPPEAIDELSGLQDRVPSAPQADIETLLARQLGADPALVFATFNPRPLAAASIAQVYQARLISGEQVAVKVQRPGIREPIERDLDILLGMTRSIERRAAWARAFGVVNLAEGFASALREELDFRVEARNTMLVAVAPHDRGGHDSMTPEVRVPRVFPEYSNDQILVVEWLDGASVRDAGPLVAELGLARHALARSLLRYFLRQLLRDGIFHADPHPGNILVLREGNLALIDFGAVGRLDPGIQGALQRMLTALDRRDAAMLADALLEIAIDTAGWSSTDEDRIERALAQLLARRLGPGMTPGPELFADLFALLFEFGLAFPPVVGGVFRALVTLQGTVTLLAPDFPFIDEARAMSVEWVRAAFSPKSVRNVATEQVLNLLPILERLPRRLDRITAAVERGTISVNVRLFADERDTKLVTRLVSRVVLAFLGATIGLIAVMLLGLPGGPVLSATLTVYQFFGYCGLFVSVVLILRVLTDIIRTRAA
ncbi:MAG TPA: AarF/UbiB family protein [Ktedonobacterales bacterium]